MSKIREMLPGEYGLLDEFLYQAIHTEPGEPRPPRSVTAGPALRAYVEGFGRTGDVAVCAEEGGEVVGAAWARLMRGYGFAGDGVPELAVSVLPGHRGRGVGTALLSSSSGAQSSAAPRCRSRCSAPTRPRDSTGGSASGRSPATTGRP